MTKAELLEAIQSTIATNGQKGITAESLANILIEMVNATQEETGSGQVVFYMGIPNYETMNYVLTEEQKAHNAKMFQIVKNSNIAVGCSLDMSDYYKIALEEDGINADGVKLSVVSPEMAYLPVDTAIIMGAAEECIALMGISDGTLVLSDGSVIMGEQTE